MACATMPITVPTISPSAILSSGRPALPVAPSSGRESTRLLQMIADHDDQKIPLDPNRIALLANTQSMLIQGTN
jgi:hypothetical protein